MSTNSTGSPYTPGAQDPQASPYGTDPRPAGAQPPAAPAPKKSRGLAIATIVGAALSVVLLVVTIVLVVGARSRNDEARNLDAQASQLEHQAVEIKAQKVCDAITRDKRNTAASLFRAYPDAHQDIASAMQRLCGDKYKTAKAVAQVSPADDDVFSYGSISCVLDESTMTVSLSTTVSVAASNAFGSIDSVDVWMETGFRDGESPLTPLTYSEVTATPTTVALGSSGTVSTTLPYDPSYGTKCVARVNSWWPTDQ